MKESPDGYLIRIPIKEIGSFYINGILRGGHTLYAYKNNKNITMMRCGCEEIAIDDFENRIEEIETDTTYIEQLRLVAKLVRLRLP